MHCNILKVITFAELGKWDCKRYFNIQVKSRYTVENFGKHIKEETEKIKPFEFPDDDFGILGVTNSGGMFDAYIERGSNIKQSYKIVEDGYIAYNPYRINVGSIGIKTSELKNNLISPAYVVFSCKETILAEYAYLLMKTEFFNRLIRDNTTGSVRQILNFDNLADIQIPVPTITEQKKLLSKIVKLEKELILLKERTKIAYKEFEDEIFE